MEGLYLTLVSQKFWGIQTASNRQPLLSTNAESAENNPPKHTHPTPNPTLRKQKKTRKEPQKAQKRTLCKAALGQCVQGARPIPQGSSLSCSGLPPGTPGPWTPPAHRASGHRDNRSLWDNCSLQGHQCCNMN